MLLWHHSLGRHEFRAAVGELRHPRRIRRTGAPAIDRATGRVFAVANDGELHSLSLTTGADVSPPLQLISAPATNKVWGGLNLVNSTLYVADASDGCDTPPWTGQIFKVSVSRRARGDLHVHGCAVAVRHEQGWRNLGIWRRFR